MIAEDIRVLNFMRNVTLYSRGRYKTLSFRNFHWTFLLLYAKISLLVTYFVLFTERIDTMSVLQENSQDIIFQNELDKGIRDFENGKVVPHEDAMKIIRERISLYGV